MGVYKTEQRKNLLAFFESHPDEFLSVQEIHDAMPKDSISLSAVYRNLTAMSEEGVIQRSLKDGKKETLYQYIGLDECKDVLHLTCTECGQTFHMEEPNSALINSWNAVADGFEINKSMTRLYGVCKRCKH